MPADQEKYIVIAPFANERLREWPLDHYRSFIELALSVPELKIHVVGTGAQRARGNALVRGFPATHVQNDCGRLTWGQLLEKIDEAQIIVANNSGIGHVAAQRGKWTVCLFAGSHSWVEWMPRGENVVVISKNVACSPCEIGADSCPNDIVCMTQLRPEFVFERCRRILKAGNVSWIETSTGKGGQ